MTPTTITIPAQFTPCCGHRLAHTKTKSSSQNTTTGNRTPNSLQQSVVECRQTRFQASTQSKGIQLHDFVTTSHGTDTKMPKLCVINDCKTTSQGSTRRKKVRFHHSAKKHDGLSPQQANLERLVLQFMKVNPNLKILVRMVNDRKLEQLRMLWFQLRRVILRAARSPRDRAPLLEKGGGKCIILRKKNLPHLKKLLAVVKKAYHMCAAFA